MQVAPEVGEARLQPEIEHDVDQRVRAPLLQRIVAAVRRRVGLDVLGGHRRPHEDEAIVEVGAVQDLARHRVEERLRALGLLVVDQQADVVELDALPQRVGAAAFEARRAELALDPLDRLQDAPVVVVDAVARDVADRAPVAGLEMPLGGARAIAEQRVVAVEAFAQRGGDRARRVVGGGRRDRGEVRRGAGGGHPAGPAGAGTGSSDCVSKVAPEKFVFALPRIRYVDSTAAPPDADVRGGASASGGAIAEGVPATGIATVASP